MIGKPKYTNGDIVKFEFSIRDFDNKIEKIQREGVIAIVDRYGVFEDNTDVHYDILVEDENMLYKHIKETLITEKTGETEAPFGNAYT